MQPSAIGVYLILRMFTLIPHIILFLTSPSHQIIQKDLEGYARKQASGYALYKEFVKVITLDRPFRNLFYHRIKKDHYVLSYIFRFLCPPMSTLFIHTLDIGPGLYIFHGFSTIIMAESIGSNCVIFQQITIGTHKGNKPVIGDNVAILTGAKVFGKVTIGNNSIVGANAVVTKDVPENCTVVGVPAYIIKKDGVRTIQSL